MRDLYKLLNYMEETGRRFKIMFKQDLLLKHDLMLKNTFKNWIDIVEIIMLMRI